LWNTATLDTIQGVGFVDLGRAWYGSYSRADFKKNIGFGLRFHCDLIAFLEKAVVRLDLARPLNDEEDDPRLWMGLSQSF
jgi:outer membrane translocation and assembly module TamA